MADGMRHGNVLADRYRLVEPLGAGGMSVVWRGHDEILGRQVAIKVLAGRLTAAPEAQTRLRAEARAVARLSHPHITTVHDYGEAPGPDGRPIPFVVMELVTGHTLAAHLRDGRAMPWPAALATGEQIAAALAAAHQRGLVHRDITPNNVMLSPDGVKLLDFGICALVADPDPDSEGVLGTPAYLAPERINGGPVTPATDVYGLGLLMYRALAGHLPWPATTTRTAQLHAHLHRDPEPLPHIPGLPDPVTDLIGRCLAKRAADRPSAAQVQRSLAAPGSDNPTVEAEAGSFGAGQVTALLPVTITGGTPPRPITYGGKPRSTRFAARTAVLSGALLLTAGLAWAGMNGLTTRDAPPRTPAAQAAQPAAAPPTCAVAYRIDRDNGRAFTATVEVRNTGTGAFEGWQLAFDLPGQQRLRSGSAGHWQQNGHTVTARPATHTLAPAGRARVTFQADYRHGNPLPTTFRVDQVVCAAAVYGASTRDGAGGGPDHERTSPAGDKGKPKAPAPGQKPPKKAPDHPARPAP